MNLIGENVQIPTVRLYRDSEGHGPGKIVNAGIYECTNYKPGKIAPVHIEDLGWVKCRPNGLILLSYPPIHVCEASEYVL